MSYKNFIKAQFPPSYKLDGDVFNVLVGAIGKAIDIFDPIQINLVSEFSVTASSGSALILNGQDWGVEKRNGEIDTAYKNRVLSMLPLYANGPTIPGMKTAIKPFTGYNPTIFEYGPSSFIMGESTIGDVGFSSIDDAFAFEVQVNNPDNLVYSYSDLKNAVDKAKLARSTAIIHNPANRCSFKLLCSNKLLIGGS